MTRKEFQNSSKLVPNFVATPSQCYDTASAFIVSICLTFLIFSYVKFWFQLRRKDSLPASISKLSIRQQDKEKTRTPNRSASLRQHQTCYSTSSSSSASNIQFGCNLPITSVNDLFSFQFICDTYYLQLAIMTFQLLRLLHFDLFFCLPKK